jgi:hypothetical protein
MNQDEPAIELELSVETLALLAKEAPTVPAGCGESFPVRCWGSVCTPPTCCP